MARAVTRLLRGGGGGANVSSVAGRTAPADFAVYAVTQLGMNGWSESLRPELQPDIGVIVIEPGAREDKRGAHGYAVPKLTSRSPVR